MSTVYVVEYLYVVYDYYADTLNLLHLMKRITLHRNYYMAPRLLFFLSYKKYKM